MISVNNNRIIKSFLLLLIFLSGCNISVDNNPIISSKKIYEKELIDKNLSLEGGSIELYSNELFCNMVVSIYGETGQEKYNFKFKYNSLLETQYQIYGYQNGILVPNDDIKDLIDKSNKENSDRNDPILRKDIKIIGQLDPDISKRFVFYKDLIPDELIEKYCN